MLECIQQSPPTIWQWIGIIAGMLAFGGVILSVPTIFQMFCGKPNIEVMLEGRDIDIGRALFFSMRNKPINKNLRRIGVYRRQADNPFFSFHIRDIETNAMKAQVRKGNLQISQLWKDFEVVHIDNRNTEIIEKDSQKLSPGKYYFELSIRADDYDKKYRAQFTVGEKSNQLDWLLKTFTVVKNGNG